MGDRRNKPKGKWVSIPSFVSVYLMLSASITIAVLVWVYLQTGELAALAYLLYVVFDWAILPMLTKQEVIDAIANHQAALWLGATANERISNFMFIVRAIRGAEAVFFVWLLLSLVS
jgi:hypothetical protein